MKKAVMTLLVIGLVLFLMVPAVMAGKNAPPKSSCWQLSADGLPLDGFNLAIAAKRSGLKIKDANGNIKFYTIQGAIASAVGSYHNVTGSGYWDETSGQFEGGISGLTDHGLISCTLYYSEANSFAYCVVPPNLASGPEYDMIKIDCGDIIID